MNSDTQVKGLQATTGGVSRCKGCPHLIENALVLTNGLTHDQATSIFERFADALATGDFAHAGVTGAVFDNDDVAGKERPVRTAQVQQHAVVARYGYDLKTGDDRRLGGVGNMFSVHGKFLQKRSFSDQ